ncbi:MAG: PKD domain-containing protein [bacterium]
MFRWHQVSGVSVGLSQDGEAASFTAPDAAGATTIVLALNVTDAWGQSSEDQVTVTILPSLRITVDPQDTRTVRFASNMPEASHTWDFGDGTPASHQAAPVHTYASGGAHVVHDAVTDSYGRSLDATAPVMLPDEASRPVPGQAGAPGATVGGSGVPSYLPALAMLLAVGLILLAARRRRRDDA